MMIKLPKRVSFRSDSKNDLVVIALAIVGNGKSNKDGVMFKAPSSKFQV